jgi:hypothetical protein
MWRKPFGQSDWFAFQECVLSIALAERKFLPGFLRCIFGKNYTATARPTLVGNVCIE